MYAVDNRYYSDKGEEYSDGITREHPRQWNGEKLFL